MRRVKEYITLVSIEEYLLVSLISIVSWCINLT